jgi:hypothetical protein
LHQDGVNPQFRDCFWKVDGIDGTSTESPETVEWTRQHRILEVLFGPVPEYDAPLPRLLAYSIAWNLPEFPAQHRMSESALLDARLASLATSTWHIPYVSLYKAICNDGDCTEYADKEHTVPLMFDKDHLSRLVRC